MTARSATPAPAVDAPEVEGTEPEVTNDNVVDITPTQSEGDPEGTPEGDDSPSEPEVELSPVQVRNKLRADLVAAIHDAGVKGLSVLENRDKQQELHKQAVALRDAGKAARDAHKAARDEVARIRGLLKD